MVRQIVLFVVAFASIVAGVWMLSPPAALIIGGLLLGAVSLSYDFKPIRRNQR